MISDPNFLLPAAATQAGQLSQGTCTEPYANALAPLEVSSSLVIPHASALIALEQPVACVKTYLANRAPVPRLEMEKRLFVRLPMSLQHEVRRLQAAVLFVRGLTQLKPPVKVQPACLRALTIYREFNPLNTFRGKYDLWISRQDWLVLVNRAKAGALWQINQRGLSDAFLDFVAARAGEFKRGDALEEAVRSIHRQWQTGRNHRGDAEVIAGYEENWELRTRWLLPDGWSIGNIRRQLAKRNKFSKGVKALLHEGIASARSHIPQVNGTRRNLRFMEMVQFDDVRCDFRVMDTKSGQVCDLWLLIARDVATGMILGFGMRPAVARDDGKQDHLKLTDMKQLAGWILETYGLPPYTMTWVLENGTATLAEAVRAALNEMLGTFPDGSPRIDFQMASMVGGKSPLGYWEKAVGNSKAKAMLESLNRLTHIMASHFPGQIGLNYSKLPAEYRDREREALAIWNEMRPEDRDQAMYPFYKIPQARQALLELFGEQNRRIDHTMEDFLTIEEWFDAENRQWKSQFAAPADMNGIRTRSRKEMPVERAGRLLMGCEPFTKVSPEVLVAFFENSQRRETVKKGELQLQIEGTIHRFVPPSSEYALPNETKVLCYFNPNDPRFLILTDGRGAILSTWLRKALAESGDKETLAAALRHSATALNEIKDRAHELAAGDRDQLERMREHNRKLTEDFTALPVPANGVDAQRPTISSPVATHVAAMRVEKKQIQRDLKHKQKLAAMARAAMAEE